LLNELVDTLEKESKAAKTDQETSPPSEKAVNGPKNGQANGVHEEPLFTWVHKNFQVTCFVNSMFSFSMHVACRMRGDHK